LYTPAQEAAAQTAQPSTTTSEQCTPTTYIFMEEFGLVYTANSFRVFTTKYDNLCRIFAFGQTAKLSLKV
jgi:hypothetical protein